MEDTQFESKSLYPTSLDNPENRLHEFVEYAVAHFNLRASTEILISLDKKNVQRGKIAKFVGKIADATVTGAVSSSGLEPIARGIGLVTGKIVEEGLSEIEKRKKHKVAKLIEHYFAGFDPKSEKWIRFLLDAFIDIFTQ